MQMAVNTVILVLGTRFIVIMGILVPLMCGTKREIPTILAVAFRLVRFVFVPDYGGMFLPNPYSNSISKMPVGRVIAAANLERVQWRKVRAPWKHDAG